MDERRVVATGVGIVAPNGRGKESFWSAIREGVSGARPLEGFGGSRYRGWPAAVTPGSRRPPRTPRDPASDLLVAAAQEAIADAALDPSPGRWRLGVVVGTIHAGMLTLEALHAALLESPGGCADPRRLAECSLAAPSWHLARRLRSHGPRATLSMTCTSGTAALGYGAHLVRQGRADAVVVGGVDTLNEFLYSGFVALQAVSPTRCRPFDRDRDGMLIGEGAAAMVLEPWGRALERGAPVYAELAGFGLSGDACGIARPHPEGAGLARALAAALDEAGLGPEQVDYINAHGVGTMLNDAMEAAAILRVFGARGEEIPVGSIKPLTGHAMGATGVFDAIVCLLALRDGVVPGIPTLASIDPRLKLACSRLTRRARVKVAVSMTSGVGGQNAALVLRSAPPRRAKRSRSPAKQPRRRGREPVAVRGLGVVHPRAIGLEAYLGLAAAEDGGPADAGAIEPRILELVDERTAPAVARRLGQVDDLTRFALLASLLAWEEAGLGERRIAPARAGVVFGTTLGSLASDLAYHRQLLDPRQHPQPSPLLFRNTAANMPAAHVSIALGLEGVNATFSSGEAAAIQALSYAADLLDGRRADLVLSGGVDAGCETLRSALAAARCRQGPAIADGAVVVALTRPAGRAALGDGGYGLIAGCGMADGASRLTAALAAAMRSALEDAGIEGAEVDALCPGGCGELLAAETAVAARLLGTGKEIGPGGPVPEAWGGGFGVLRGLLALRAGARVVIVNAIGFDGCCASLVLRRPAGERR